MFYGLVISQPIELKFDSALEDISRSHNLLKKTNKQKTKKTNKKQKQKNKKNKTKKKRKTTTKNNKTTNKQIFRRVPLRLSGLTRSQAPRSPIQLLTAISVA